MHAVFKGLPDLSLSLEDAHIRPNPLLNEGRKECGTETEYEAHKPVNVHSAVRGRWMKGRVRQWLGNIEGDLVADRWDLL
jgi:hypothetical protein